MNIFEAKIVKAIQSISTKFLDDFFKVITQFGSIWAVLVVTVLFLLFFGLRGTVRYLFIIGAASLAGVLTKYIIARPRPYLFSVGVGVTEKTSAGGYSFPSSHTIAIVITALSFYFMISRILKETKTSDDPERVKKNKKKKIWIKALIFSFLVILTLLVAFSRVYLGVHYLSDVIFALLFGIVCYYVFALLYDKYIEKLIFKRARHANPKQ